MKHDSNNPGRRGVSLPDRLLSRIMFGLSAPDGSSRFVAIPVMWRSFTKPATGTARAGSTAT